MSQRNISSTVSATRSNKKSTNFCRLGPKFDPRFSGTASPEPEPILARMIGRVASRDLIIPGMRDTSSGLDDGTNLGISTAGFGRVIRGEAAVDVD